MKKTMKMMLALMAGAMAFTACSSDDILENIENNEVAQEASQLNPMTFTAIQEGQGTTRATIDGLDIKWSAGDKISIFDGSDENGGDQMFTIENGAGTTSATFTGSAASSATYYALYPYAVARVTGSVPSEREAIDALGGNDLLIDMLSIWKDDYEECSEELRENFFDDQHVNDVLNDEGISEENKAIVYTYITGQAPVITPGVALEGSNITGVVIPAQQTVAEGQTVDPQAMIMVAKGDEANTLAFKNVCAYVKVTPQFDCAAIGITSKGKQPLAGNVKIDYNDGNPTTTVTADGKNCVTLAGDLKAGTSYYIAVRPETLSSGFTIEFLTADKATYYARSTNNALALARSSVKNLGEFTTSGTWTTTLATIGNDGSHSWQLLSPGIKLATSHACISIYTNDNATSWGADWVLPTKDDCELLCAQKCITYSGGTLTICGAGVLRYVGNIVITSDSENFEDGMWSSTPYPSLNAHYNIDLSKGNVDWDYDTVWCFFMIFKYTR